MKHLVQHQILIEKDTFTYTLERKAVKNINLRIRRDGSIYVSAAPRVPLAYIEAFLQKQGDFIRSSLEECRQQRLPFLTLRSGDTLLLKGLPYRLDVRLGLHNSVRRRDDLILMETTENTWEQRRNLYHDLLRKEGDRLFAASACRMMPQLSPYGIQAPKLRQRIMRSRWGSCMPLKGIITMNTYLAVMTESIIDYVMLHELCHLVHPNHSRHFYNVMTMVMPDWKDRRAAMTAYLPYCI